MLSAEMKRREELYGFRNNCYNVVWLTGLVRDVDLAARTASLHRTNNPNQGFPFSVKPTDRLPADLAEVAAGEEKARSVSRKIIARMSGTRNDRGLPSIALTAIHIAKPNVIELPPAVAFKRPLRPGIPNTVATSDQDLQELPAETKSTDLRVLKELRTSVVGNDCKLSGFIQAMNFTPARARDDGSGSTVPSLEVLIRQTEDANDLIPVVLRGKTAKKTYESLRPRDPIFVLGKLEMLIKNVGEADAAGVLPVSRRMVLRTEEIQLPDQSDVLISPPWLETIPLDAGSRRTQAPRGAVSQPAPGEQSSGPVAAPRAVEERTAPPAVPSALLERLVSLPPSPAA